LLSGDGQSQWILASLTIGRFWSSACQAENDFVAGRICFVGAWATKQSDMNICSFRYLEKPLPNEIVGQCPSAAGSMAERGWSERGLERIIE
jgi:hypothetical protein